LVLFRQADGEVPLLEWLGSLQQRQRKRCLASLVRLAELGHEIRRPHADYLRDGIHELRVKSSRVNYRILYFFHGRQAVVVSHGLLKQQRRVPEAEIELAIRRRRAFESDPETHSHSGV
jgi:phage-related protein